MLNVGQWSVAALEKRPFSQPIAAARTSMKSTTKLNWMRLMRLPSAPPSTSGSPHLSAHCCGVSRR
jgi:hypothetical protein